MPDQIALLWEGGQRTYSELRDTALRLAAALQARGLAEGDRVASFLMNRGETFELYFACAFAGLTFVPISFRLTVAEVALILADCTPGIILTDSAHRSLIDEAVERAVPGTPVLSLETNATGRDYATLIASAAPLPVGERRTTAVQLILYTSGTTGRPKGVAMRHGNILWCAFQQVTFMRGLSARSVMLIVGPLYNTAGINESSIPTFLVGGTVAILPSTGWTPERFGQFVERFQATHCLLFPSMMQPILDADAKSPLPLDSLHYVYTGGENCPPAVMAAWRRRFPDKHLCVSYGSTESGFPTVIEDEEIEQFPGSVGRTTPGQSVRILSAEGKQVRPGEIGEVWTAGPAVISSYWNAPEIDAVTIRDGWLKMGDLGRMNEDGHLYIVGRVKDMIISKGQNIYPAEVENALRAHPGLSDVAVVGVPDDEFGEAVCAAVICREGQTLDPDEIIAFSRQTLASYKKPRHVVFLDVFPRGLSGKVKKDEVTKTCRERLGL
ncbi:MAG: AMP-binding protein [Hyphomicrobiaceae bacterium]